MHPVLWHIKVSPYSEKTRWALDYKGVAHSRRAVDGDGTHSAMAQRFTDGDVATMPVLVVDGRGIGDSTEIVAFLEREYPARPLYPYGSDARERVLELEEFFDEEFAPYMRRAGINQMMQDPEFFVQLFLPDAPDEKRQAALAAFPQVRHMVSATLEIDEHSVAHAYDKIAQAGERFRSELGLNGYFDPAGFGLADLTLAGLAGPIVAAESFPYDPQAAGRHPLLEPVREALASAGILPWAEEMYARHRGVSAEVPAMARA